MMIETVKTVLKELNCDTWQISDLKTEGWEFYFIKNRLDQNRVRNTDHITLTVFMKNADGTQIGSASAEIRQGSIADEIRDTVKTLMERAQLIQNPVYSLHSPKKAEETEKDEADVRTAAEAYLHLLKDIHQTAEADLNSTEIFVEKNTEHLLNSNGIDVTQTWLSSMIETVINARNEKHEIELLRQMRSGTCNEEELKKQIEDTMQYGLDRLKAQKTPNLNRFPVVFRGESAKAIAGWFVERTDAAMIYRKMSSWKKDAAYAENISGDRLTLKALKNLSGSADNRMYDAEGAAMKDLTLIENGIVKNFWGSRMFASYIGENDSFIVSNYEIDGGSESEESIQKEPYLEAVDFSDFQADSLTGDFFGEIRLAYYHDGRNVIPVSGGSVSGNLNDLMGEMTMSAQRQRMNNALIPSFFRLKDVTVTGSEG